MTGHDMILDRTWDWTQDRR